ncbi:hypothetical protein [Bacillus sp. JCM 19034]|uniref:hypothetical protein n=1 Tax=Bacillus sp. JCM 19034 TaxID=1481928 RepID=UPI0007804DAB|nr:hypothetical protein [Bacillus sp. JCM 19034]
MSLVNVHFLDVVKKQYAFKIRSYMGSILTLIILQIFAILLAVSTTNYYHSMDSIGISIKAQIYSSDIVVIFTILWSFITAILMTTKAYRYDDYTFIATRMSSHLANIYYLITVSLFASMTTMLAGIFIKSITYFTSEAEIYYRATVSLTEYAIGFGASFLYMFVVAMIGYTIGLFVQWNRLFAIFIPVLFVGGLFYLTEHPQSPIFKTLIKFYFQESSFNQFFIKSVTIILALFLLTSLISKRLEVRQ